MLRLLRPSTPVNRAEREDETAIAVKYLLGGDTGMRGLVVLTACIHSVYRRVHEGYSVMIACRYVVNKGRALPLNCILARC